MKQAPRRRLIIARDVLLVEIERRCQLPECNAKTRLGLTKEDARAYEGFECEGCKGWNEDYLTERDVPQWWEELVVTGLHGLHAHTTDEPYEPSEPVKRMSNDYRRINSSETNGKDEE